MKDKALTAPCDITEVIYHVEPIHMPSGEIFKGARTLEIKMGYRTPDFVIINGQLFSRST